MPSGDNGTASEVLLEVKGLQTEFFTDQGTVHAVNGVSFRLRRGEVLSLVGESGCGKTATVLSLLRLLPQRTSATRADEILFQGKNLLDLDRDAIRRLRGADIGMIFQDPLLSLNPVLTIGRQLTEAMEVHLGSPPAVARARALELLQLVGIPDPRQRIDDYPHQFSGGMCQRVMIAMALSCDPSLLIADEPTTALDVTIQAEILELVTRMRASSNMAIIWITHDLGVVAELADRVAVMYGGSIVEYGSVDDIFGSPQHPYTLGLLASTPRMERQHGQRLPVIPGQPPGMVTVPPGCVFAERCKHAFERCWHQEPPLLDLGDTRKAACWWDVDRRRERRQQGRWSP